MNDFTIAYLLAGDNHRREVLSARPDAPVVPHVANRPRRSIIRLAGRLEGLSLVPRRNRVRVAGPTPCSDC
jgi:hypothetical protein